MINDYVLDLNQFQVIKTIGEGAFGKVLLIENKKTGEKFAAKSNKKSCQEQGVQKEFYREIESFIKAKYPSILRFIGHNMLDFDSNPYPTFVTEYMPNSSLLEILDRSKAACAPFEWDDTKRYINLIGIALGMKHLHSKSIVHRDLKPANILLDEDFYPRICDFGLSILSDKQINELLMSSTGVGTPLYMAPEIFTGQSYTPKVDIYAFGIMAFEIITNIRRPIQISNIKGQQNQFFLKKCLSQDPVNRPTFYEVCEYMVTKDFIDLFGQINYNEVDYFLDLFNKDPEAVFIHALFLSINDSKKAASNFYRESADAGFPEAMNSYANMLEKGEGVQMNKEEAVRYYKMAIDKGNSTAMNNYANMLAKGEGIKMNKEEAVRYYKMAIDKGNSTAIYNYANMLYSGEGIKMNKEEAARYYKMSADKGNHIAIYNYANMLAKGEGIQMNKKEAARYYKMSADKGNSDAMINYGYMLANGEGIQMNKKEAARYYKMSADKGNSTAMNNYANMLTKGEGIQMNKIEAARYYKMAIGRGSPTAMNNYANMLVKGEGIQNSMKEAARYYKMSADKGNSDAMINYANMLAKGEGIQVNKKEAVRYYKMAIDKGNSTAMNNYANMLTKGEGIQMNKVEAVRYYKMSADKGNSNAMYNYANMLEKGEGIQMNKKEAARYYKTSADKGNSTAMYNYANMLAKGEGIQMNKKEAARYYKMSADKGNFDAMYNYANMLAKGEGIQMNKEEAARYYKMSADKGNSNAMYNYANMLAKGNEIQMGKGSHQHEILSEEQLRELPPPLPKSSYTLGIDFGTTTTRFGIYKNSKLDDRISEIVLPSAVAFSRYSGKPYFNFLSTINKKSKSDNKTVKSGFSASGHHHICLIDDDDDPTDIMINDDYIVVPAIKRLLGREISQETEQSLPFELKLSRSKKKEIKITDTVSLSFEQIAALILAEGKRMVEDKIKEDISDAILCVPGFFSNNQKNSMRDAAQIAGFNVVKLISETVAVVTALRTNDGKHLKEIQDLDGSCISRKITGIGASDASSSSVADDDITKAIVVKFGGGNIDTSIVEFSKGTATIDRTSGDTSIGGIDIDKAIAHLVLSKIPKDKASSIKKSKAAIRVLEQACEAFRIKNSKKQQSRSQNAKNDEGASKIVVDGIIDNFNLDVQITDSEYASVLEPFLRKLTECLEDLFKHNTKTNPNDIKELIFVGGVMKTSLIRDAVTNFILLKSSNRNAVDSTSSSTPQLKVIEINPIGIILGASIQAAIIRGDTSIKSIKIMNTVIISIRISLADGTTDILIPRGKPIPCSNSTMATTFKDNQRNVTFDIVEGERMMAEDNIKIGNVCVKGIEEAPRGVPNIEIKMSIDEEGILLVEAQDKKTGADMKTRIVSNINLRNNEVKKMLAEAELNKQKDVYRRKQAETKSRFKFYLLEMESKGKSIKNHEFWDKIDKYYDWIDENNDAKPSEYIDMYRKSKKELDLYINNQ